MRRERVSNRLSRPRVRPRLLSADGHRVTTVESVHQYTDTLQCRFCTIKASP